MSSAALGADGTVYVGSKDSHLHAVAEANGAPKWKAQTHGMVGCRDAPCGI